MTQATIAASVDGYIQSVSTVYATAASSYVAGFVNSGNTLWQAGQRLNGANYELYQAHIRWSLASIPTTARIISASIRVTNSGSPPANRKDTYFRDRDPGGVITSADYVDQTTLAAMDLFATMPTANNGSNTTYTLTGTAAFIAKIQANLGGNVGCIVVSDTQVSSTAPTTADQWTFKSAEDATAGNRPALIVDYSENLGSRIVAGPKLSRMRIVG